MDPTTHTPHTYPDLNAAVKTPRLPLIAAADKGPQHPRRERAHLHAGDLRPVWRACPLRASLTVLCSCRSTRCRQGPAIAAECAMPELDGAPFSVGKATLARPLAVPLPHPISLFKPAA